MPIFLDAHLAGDALRVLFQAIAGLVIGAPAVHTLAAHPLGTAGAGRI